MPDVEKVTPRLQFVTASVTNFVAVVYRLATYCHMLLVYF